MINFCMALEKQRQDSPQSSPRSPRSAPQSASVFSVPSVVKGSSDGKSEKFDLGEDGNPHPLRLPQSLVQSLITA